MKKTNQHRPIPPRSSHDVHETEFGDLRPWLEQDLDDMIAEGDVGPHLMITRTKTRFIEAIESLSRSGFGDGPRSLPRMAGQDRPAYNAQERLLMGARMGLDEIYLDILNLNLHGNRVYHYTDAVVQWMLNTRINLPCEEIETPYPSLAMTSRSETLVRLFLGPSRQNVYKNDLTIAITASLGTERQYEDMTYRTLHLTTHLLMRGMTAERTLATIRLEHGMRAAEAVRNYCAGAQSVVNSIEPEREEALGGWFGENAEAYYRTIINCLLYLTLPSAKISEPYDVHNPRIDILGTRSRAPVHDVGKDMTPIYVSPSDIFRLVKKGRKGAGEKLAWRVLVAGHWRSWPGYAATGDKTRRNWIKPFWRGDEANPVRNKEYVVVKDEEQ